MSEDYCACCGSAIPEGSGMLCKACQEKVNSPPTNSETYEVFMEGVHKGIKEGDLIDVFLDGVPITGLTSYVVENIETELCPPTIAFGTNGTRYVEGGGRRAVRHKLYLERRCGLAWT